MVQALLPLAAALSGAVFVFMLWSPSLLSLLSPEAVVSFFYYCGFVIFGLKGMQNVWAAFLRQGGAIERLNTLFGETHTPHTHQKSLGLTLSGGSPSIEFDHVWFHYPSTPDRWVLKDVSLSIAPGEKVAIIGPSGTGKTTLFLLLVGLYRPVRGRILIGGVNLEELDLDQVRKSIGIVQQAPLIFSGSLKDNITMGDPTLTQSQVDDILHKVHLSDFVHTLSHGVETFLGEKGVRLSGGQKQRLSLARVLLKNPSILMFDEATSALDLETEELIYSHLSLHTRAKTCLTISHRLSTIIPHETTYVLSQGKMQKQDHRQRAAGSV